MQAAVPRSSRINDEREVRTKLDTAFLNACAREVPVAAWTSWLSNFISVCSIYDRAHHPDSPKRQKDRVRTFDSSRRRGAQQPVRRARHRARRQAHRARRQSQVRAQATNAPPSPVQSCMLTPCLQVVSSAVSLHGKYPRQLHSSDESVKTKRGPDVAAAAPGHPTCECARARAHANGTWCSSPSGIALPLSSAGQ